MTLGYAILTRMRTGN